LGKLFAENRFEQSQNEATLRRLGELPNNEPTKGTRAAIRPGQGKEKGDTENQLNPIKFG